MSNIKTNKVVNIGILEISTPNKAIIEFYFSNLGKSVFKEVAVENATAFIIDYDFPGAKESWDETFRATNKPGIIISIHEIDLPSTIWIAKPLTAKALTDAGHKIQEMISANQPKEKPTAAILETKIEAKTETLEAIETTSHIAPELEVIEPSITATISPQTVVENNKPTQVIAEKQAVLATTESPDFSTEPNAIIPAKPVKMDAPNSATPLSKSTNRATQNKNKNDSVNSEIDRLLESLISGKGSEVFNSPASSENQTDFSPPILNTDKPIEIELTLEENIETTESLVDKPQTNNLEEKQIDDLLGVLVDANDSHLNDDLPIIESVETTGETNELEQVTKITEALNDSIDNPIVSNEFSSKDSAQATEKKDDDELQRLLEEIRQEAEGNISEEGYSHRRGSDDTKNNEIFNTNAEKRWALTCGEREKVTSATDLKKNSYQPDEHLLTPFNEALQLAKNNKKVMRLKLGQTIIIIHPKENLVYCNNPIMEEAYAELCYNPIRKDKVKIHSLDTSEVRMILKKHQSEPENSHSISSFIWTTSLLSSRGRLPEKTNLKQIIGAKHWPDLTRLESFPHVIQVAAVFKKKPGSLLDFTQWLEHVPQSSIFAFYNGVLALNLIEQDQEKLKHGNRQTKDSPNTTNRGFFSRLLKRIAK